MKDFITSIAAVLILMMFVMQFAANQATFIKIMGAEHAIREVSLISENQGMIKSESIAELKSDLAGILKCGEEEIQVHISGGLTDRANEGEEVMSLELEVMMPVYGVIGPAGVLGISPADNVRRHMSSNLILLEPETEPGNTEPETEPVPEAPDP